MVLSNDNLILYPTHPDLTLKSRSFGAKLVLDQISSGKFDPDTLYVFINAHSYPLVTAETTKKTEMGQPHR